MLENETDIALLNALLRCVLVAEEDRPLGRRFQPGNEAQKRGLARTGRPQQGDQLAGTNIQRDIMQRREASELLTHSGNTNFHSQSFPLPPCGRPSI